MRRAKGFAFLTVLLAGTVMSVVGILTLYAGIQCEYDAASAPNGLPHIIRHPYMHLIPSGLLWLGGGITLLVLGYQAVMRQPLPRQRRRT